MNFQTGSGSGSFGAFELLAPLRFLISTFVPLILQGGR